MILYIDTTEFGKVKITLEYKSKKTSKIFFVKPQESKRILENLDAFLKKAKIPASPAGRKNSKSKIKKIIIYKGKGSFTGLRIAAAIAQALGLVWNIPVKVIKK